MKTPLVAKLLAVNYPLVRSLIRDGRMEAPPKDTSGHYLWSESDIERARAALKVDRRRKKPEPAQTS
jgi:hypothetical protein